MRDFLNGLEQGPEGLRGGSRTRRVAILGIGNELHGDDAAGVLIARNLKEKMQDRKPTDASPGMPGEVPSSSLSSVFKGPGREAEVLIYEAGMAPEAFTGPLRRFAPDLVLLIDAAELGEPAGTVRWFDWQEAEGLSASTHTLPPSVLAEYLLNELHCTVVLLGIQPQTLGFDEGMTPPVRSAVRQVTSELLDFLVR